MGSSNGTTRTMGTVYTLSRMIGYHRLGYFKVMTGWTSWPCSMKGQTEARTQLKSYQRVKNGRCSTGGIIFKRGMILFWLTFIV